MRKSPLDTKQIRLESLVTSYFNQRDDTSVRPMQGGRYKIRLTSESARSDFGRGMDELVLIFDSEEAYNYKDVELITANHPLLDIIRNDLERRENQDPRICEAYIPLQVVSPDGEIALPIVKLLNLKYHDLNFHIAYSPYYVFTYRIVYEMDGGSENIVKITISGATGDEVQDLLSKIDDNLLISGKPEIVSGISEISLSTIKERSQAIIQQRVVDDLESIGNDNATQLEKESARITEYYANEINKLSDDDRTALEISKIEAARDRQLAEWRTKFEYKAKIQPLSVMKFWLPLVNYQLVIPSSRGNFTIDDITYTYYTDDLNLYKCKKCGNSRTFNICFVGHHPICANGCNEKIDSCKVCHDEFCEKHGGGCSSCNDPVCLIDSQKCAYGKHSRGNRFCSECITESFEGKPLCKECLDICDLCERKFPHELVTVCRIGSERICFDHKHKPDGFKCMECGNYTCSSHGSYTEDNEWACEDHQLVSSCCRKSFKLSSLEACCCDINEKICKTHSEKCLNCGKTVCENHRYPLKDHRGKYVCANCRKTCSECSTDKSYIASDLKLCIQCHKPVCKSHQRICAVGGEVICSSDAKTSVKGEILCQLHIGYCVQTGIGEGKPIYRTDELQICTVCNQTVCSDHISACEVCGSSCCTSHISTRPKCTSCGSWSCASKGCSADSHTCKWCGMKYCRKCISNKGICHTCESLANLKDPNQWINYLFGVQRAVGGENGRILGEILQSRNKLNLWAASNKTYSVVVLRYVPHVLEFWKEKHQFRFVITKSDGRVVNIRREKAA